ncbi:MAG: stage II sporulation protein D [Bacilli bacterium]|nr:stage II sporulation protein D [Bacilli bacterium]
MKNKILCGVIVSLSIVLLIEVSFKKKTNFSFDGETHEEIKNEPKEESQEKIIRVYDPTTTKIENMNLEDYIIGVVAAEMPASFEIEALKAQAIAARTFATYKMEHRSESYDIIIGVADQAYNTPEQMQNKWGADYEKNYDKIKTAVQETKGDIMTYQGQTIESFYFSMSNGQTENCELVFQEALPYLTSVDSNWDNESLQNYEVTKEFSKQDFCNLLNISCEEINISDINRTSTGRINTLRINGNLMKGTDVRKKLSLRSTDFDITIENSVKITTRGSGHGVGMSQYGANGMAKEGKTYQEILTHYYQNIEFSKI